MKSLILLSLCAFFMCIGTQSFAQNKKTSLELCDNHLNDGFVSDGQYYTYTLQQGEIKQTKITLMGGNIYRIAACAMQTQQLQFSLIDASGTVLYSNTGFDYAPYWDFEIKQTIECVITIQNNDSSIKTDKAILIIGYKR